VANLGQFLEQQLLFLLRVLIRIDDLVLHSAGHRITWRVVSRNCDRSLPVMFWNWVTILAERQLTSDGWESCDVDVVVEHGMVEAMAVPVSPHGFRRTRRRPQSPCPTQWAGLPPTRPCVLESPHVG
jgi:hypothetical protein